MHVKRFADAKTYESMRRIEVTPATAALIRRRIAGKGPSELVFTNAEGRRWLQQNFLNRTWTAMLKDAGASFVIVGHSERRADHGENDAAVKAKASAALAAGLSVIVCVGESEAERDAGKAEDVVAKQLKGSLPTGKMADKVTVAYEPVWAIGTGRTPSIDDIASMHRAIRRKLVAIYGEGGADIRILYGGSVKAENAAEILRADEVGGALVGGASLTAESFLGIIVAAAELAEG